MRKRRKAYLGAFLLSLLCILTLMAAPKHGAPAQNKKQETVVGSTKEYRIVDLNEAGQMYDQLKEYIHKHLNG